MKLRENNYYMKTINTIAFGGLYPSGGPTTVACSTFSGFCLPKMGKKIEKNDLVVFMIFLHELRCALYDWACGAYEYASIPLVTVFTSLH